MANIYEGSDPTLDLLDLMTYSATSYPDTMHFDQGMREPDRDQFLHAVIKEVNDHIDRNHRQLVPGSSVPQGMKVLPSVWSLKRKRDIETRQMF